MKVLLQFTLYCRNSLQHVLLYMNDEIYMINISSESIKSCTNHGSVKKTLLKSFNRSKNHYIYIYIYKHSTTHSRTLMYHTYIRSEYIYQTVFFTSPTVNHSHLLRVNFTRILSYHIRISLSLHINI